MLSIVDNGPAPPCPRPYNLALDVLAPAQSTPDKAALVLVGSSGHECWSYARLAQAVEGLGGALQTRGYAPGSFVLLRLGNSVAFPIAFLASLLSGLVPVPVSQQWTRREVEAAIAEISPALVLADPELPTPTAGCDVLFSDTLGELCDHRPVDPVMGDPAEPAFAVFTSGTAGVPRLVLHAHRAFRARRMMWDGWYGLSREDRVMHAGAFNWTFTLGTGLLDPWSAGATALVPQPETSPDELGMLIQEHDATIFAAAPGIYRKLLASGSTIDAPALRHGLSAGEKLPAGTRDAWTRATGVPVHEAFGMSECSTFLSGAPGRPAPRRSLGFAQPGRVIAVVDRSGTPLPRGEPGILAVDRQDPGLMLGYPGHEDETRRSYVGRWFLTGDRAVMRADGAVDYLGRDDDMMNAGGLRVSPIEVETALAAHSSIVDCAVTEIRVRDDASIIAAFYVSPAPLDESDLAAHMSKAIARYKCPRVYIRVAELTRNPNGKLLRRAMAAAYEARNDQA